MKTTEQNERVVFAGGCFWCTEAIFAGLNGVQSVAPGYAGGMVEHPSYEQVSSGTTGHAEAVEIEYDPTKIGFRDLLTVFFATHDPTTKDRQGNDVGTQYRSVVFFTTEEQREAAEAFIAELSKESPVPIVTEVRRLERFYHAEDYHQRYYEEHRGESYCQVVIRPKLEKLQAKFSALLRV
jgi:peptide-methionine (S)-S-oxide reductase